MLRRSASDLAASLQEAVLAGIVDDSGAELSFRHPLIRQALYESMPEALRAVLHADAARELAATGADTLRVAQQLSAANGPREIWVRAWLAEAAPALATRAPQLAVELVRGALEQTAADDVSRDALVVGLVRALIAVGGYEEAVGQASWALTTMTDPALRGETSWMLAHAQVGTGFGELANETIRQALAAADVPPIWEARLLALLALFERDFTGFDAAETTSRQALAAAEQAADPYATAQALNNLWLINSVRRDHATALDCIDRALHLMGYDPGHAELRSNALDARTFTLQNLDRWPQAELALQQAREFAQRTGRPDRATWASAAVLRYWLGQWDDALAELGPDADDSPGLVYSFLLERWSALLVHGVAALIAGRREQRRTAAQHLSEGLALPMKHVGDRENRDFLVAAHALSLEQSGETRQAMLRLAEIFPRRENEMTLTHQWLPDLVRLALAVGDTQVAQAAAKACHEEAAAETRPARAVAASLRCDGLLESDPDRLAEAVAHYRTVGPAVELPAALEDLAVVLAEHGPGQGGAGCPERGRWLVRGHAGPMGHPAGRRPAAPARRPAGGPGQTRAARHLRLGRAHRHRGQDRRPGRQQRLDVGHRPWHVPVPADCADLRLPHPGQARRQEPARHRPRGPTPGHLLLAAAAGLAADFR